MLDPNVQHVIDKFRSRAKQGFKKYGVDTTRTDLTTLDWLNHAQDEAMDFCIYLERLKQEFRTKPTDIFELPGDLEVQRILQKKLSRQDKTISTIPYRGLKGRQISEESLGKHFGKLPKTTQVQDFGRKFEALRKVLRKPPKTRRIK